jgi:hypothetical protein
MRNDYYVYIFLDPRKPGSWIYKEHVFHHKPFYIGKGTGDRITDHFTPYLLKIKSLKTNKIKKIIKECQSLPIYYKIYENLLEDDSLKLEKELIKHFGRVDLKTGILRNNTQGGENRSPEKLRKPVWQYDLNGNFIKRYESLTQASKYANCDISNITTSIKINGTCNNFIWSNKYLGLKIESRKKYNNKDNLKVYQYELNGNFKKEFSCSKRASEEIGNNSDYQSILNCANGRIKSCYGFMWFKEFLGDKINPYKTNRIMYQYIQMDLNGNYIQIFDNEKKVRESLGLKRCPNLNVCCINNSGRTIAYGFKWARKIKKY